MTRGAPVRAVWCIPGAVQRPGTETKCCSGHQPARCSAPPGARTNSYSPPGEARGLMLFPTRSVALSKPGTVASECRAPLVGACLRVLCWPRRRYRIPGTVASECQCSPSWGTCLRVLCWPRTWPTWSVRLAGRGTLGGCPTVGSDPLRTSVDGSPAWENTNQTSYNS